MTNKSKQANGISKQLHPPHREYCGVFRNSTQEEKEGA